MTMCCRRGEGRPPEVIRLSRAFRRPVPAGAGRVIPTPRRRTRPIRAHRTTRSPPVTRPGPPGPAGTPRTRPGPMLAGPARAGPAQDLIQVGPARPGPPRAGSDPGESGSAWSSGRSGSVWPEHDPGSGGFPAAPAEPHSAHEGAGYVPGDFPAPEYPAPEYPAPEYRGSDYPGPRYPGHDEPGAGEYSGTEYPGPDYPAPEDYSGSRAHVTWGRDPADEPGEGDW